MDGSFTERFEAIHVCLHWVVEEPKLKFPLDDMRCVLILGSQVR